jgi:hypothetical protein
MDSARISLVSCATGLVLLLVGVVHCGGITSSPVGDPSPAPDAGPPGHPSVDSGVPLPDAGLGGCGVPFTPPPAVVCAPTSTGVGSSAVACLTDTDCNDAGPLQTACAHGRCAADGCFTDTDCPQGLACECAIQFQGDGIYANRCVTPLCYGDADCGEGGVCSPAAPTTECGGVAGSYCHRAADTCTTNADCCGDTPVCTFDPTQGHWACVAIQTCSG